MHAPLFGSARESAASALRNMYNRAGAGAGNTAGAGSRSNAPDIPPAAGRAKA